MEQALEREWEVFEQQRARLLESHAGEFVLIHGEEILGFFGSRSEARKAGYQQLGKVPFLIQEIAEPETPHRIVYHTVRG